MYDELRRFIEAEEAADRFSGVAVVEHDGDVVFAAAAGHAHLGFGVRNEVDTRLNTASITKLCTTVAVLQLVEQGALSRSTTVADLLPDLGIGSADRITVDHLLSHRSGLGDYWNERCQQRRSTLRTTDAYLALVEGEQPAFEPGTATAYGNSGFVLLGGMIERVTGRSYYDVVRDDVCRRAGMARAEHVQLDHVEDVAHGYTTVEWEGPAHPDRRTDNVFQYPVRGSAATGLYASGPELIRFGLALRAPGELLEAASIECMLGPTGYGTQRVPYSLGTAVGHGGRAFGAATILLFLPEAGMSVCILSNYDRPADKVVFAELDRLLAARPA